MKTALISVSNKEGIVDFAKQLSKLNVKIVSTGKTAELLKKNKINATNVSEITKFPEMLDGRIKSLHPNIFAGILAERGNKKHENELKKLNINKIDIVVVNFYPFEETLENQRFSENHRFSSVLGNFNFRHSGHQKSEGFFSAIKKSSKLKESIENIDIGGPSLVRAAAKNHRDVLVIVDPNDYSLILEKLKNNKITEEDRLKLAAKAFMHTARYDSIINAYFNNVTNDNFPDVLNLTFRKLQNLRYGENPYQSASFYEDIFVNETCVSNAKQLQGKELSFNNILDIDAAFELVKDFDKPSAAVIKHTNPCGVASASTIEKAYKKAHETDPLSAFGSIVALNRNCNEATAKIMKQLFIEVVICPKFEKNALSILKEKKNLRLMETGAIKKQKTGYDLKKVAGGLLAQTPYNPEISQKDLKTVTKRKPSKEQIEDMLFAWKVNKHTKSNSIVLAKKNVSVGIGAGQMSRVDAVKLAVIKSEGKSQGSVLSSDAFFPFRDGIEEAAKAGITAIIQPGGSIRDEEVIKAADENNIAMVFTGIRLFKH